MLHTSNESFITTGLLILFVLVLLSLIIIRKFTINQRFKILFYLLIAFCVLYFPILEYWSIWIPNLSFWPGDYIVEKSVLRAPIANELLYDRIYLFLTITCALLVPISMILFIDLVLRAYPDINKKQKVLSWIPLINIIQLYIILIKNLTGKPIKLVLLIWLAIILIGSYYKFFALHLAEIGVNSYSILDYIIFGKSYQEPPDTKLHFINAIGYSSFYLMDLTRIIMPIFEWFSALLTILMVNKMKYQYLSSN